MAITFTILQDMFSEVNNKNDTVTLVDYETGDVFRTCKIKELRKVPLVEPFAYGFSSRLFDYKKNEFTDGFYIYVKKKYVI